MSSSCILKPVLKITNDQLSTIKEFLFLKDEQDLSFANIISAIKFKSEQFIEMFTNQDAEEENDEETIHLNDSDSSQGTEAPAGVNNWLDMEFESSEKSEAEIENSESSKWLRTCLLSISPNLDVIVIANFQRLIAGSNLSKFASNFSIDCRLKIAYEKDYISSVIVLPISSTRKTESSTIDWHCIVVGLSNGNLNFYTERGVLIFVEHISTEPIKAIRFNSSNCAGNQELTILSHNRFIIFEGLSLFSTLKAARSSIARGDKTALELSSTLELNFHVLQPDSSKNLYDVQITGAFKPSYIETYVTASRSDSGSNSKVSMSSLPTYSSYFGISRDALSIFWHDKSLSPSLFSEAFQSVTNQISNSIPSFGFRSFLGIGVSKKDLPSKKNPLVSSAVRLPIRATLKDSGRIAERSYFAPEPWNLVGVVDENARISLISTVTRRVIRIWKGYRNAKLSWIESNGKTFKKSNQIAKALFLVIFAPRRGLIENGPRVGQFNVDRHGRLLSILPAKDSILGCQTDMFSNLNSLSAVFISPNGFLYQVQVPFHLAASDASATTLHDEHLLKDFQLSTFIKKRSLDTEKWINLFDNLRSFNSKKKFLEALWKSDKVNFDSILNVIEDIEKSLVGSHSQGNKNERKSFELYLRALTLLTRAFSILKEAENLSSSERDNCMADLCLNKDEYDALFVSLLRKNLLICDMPTGPSLDKFLNQFEIEVSSKDLDNDDFYHLKKLDVDEFALCTRIFLPYVLRNGNVEQLFSDVLPLLKLTDMKTLDLFLIFWLAKWNTDPFTYTSKCCAILEHLYHLIIKNPTLIEVHTLNSLNVKAALCIYLCLKAINRKQNRNKNLPDDVNEGVDCLESDDNLMFLSDNYFEWVDLLISNFNCLSLLDIVQKPQSLNNFITNGAQTGLWLANGSFRASEIKEIVDHRLDNLETDKFLPDIKNFDIDLLRVIASKFPLSFQSDLLFTDCSWEAASLWYKDESRKVIKLKTCLDFLELNQSKRLKHGLALMLWDTFLREPFKNLFSLLNRRGLPEGRFIRREVLVNENDLLDFVLCVKRLFKVLCASVVDLEMQPMPFEAFEDFIENFFDHLNESNSKRKLLTETAANHKSINYHLCLHHLHLVTIIELQLTLGIKNKPEVLFDQIGIRAFFEPLHSHPLIPLGNKDVGEILRVKRQKFLELCIQSVGITADSHYFKIWETALFLASEWQLNVDSCRTKEIIMLYEHSFDDLVHEIVPLVHDRNSLAGELISIIAVRLKNFFDQDQSLMEKIIQNSLSSPDTIEYINSFVELIAPATCEQIHAVIRLTKTLLVSSKSDTHTAQRIGLIKDFEQITNYIAANSSNL